MSVPVYDIRRIAVIGAGIMGHGIAQEFEIAGYEVALYDIDQARLDAALARINGNLTSLADAGSLSSTPATVLSRLSVTTSLADAASHVDYVVEAAPEQLTLKQQLFADLDRLTPPQAILA